MSGRSKKNCGSAEGRVRGSQQMASARFSVGSTGTGTSAGCTLMLKRKCACTGALQTDLKVDRTVRIFGLAAETDSISKCTLPAAPSAQNVICWMFFRVLSVTQTFGSFAHVETGRQGAF